MPANSKYLSNNWTRFSKVTAAIFGAYFASAAFHMGIANVVSNDTPALLTATYSMFLLWCGLMIMVFLLKKAWVSWSILLAIILISSFFLFS